MPIEQLWISPHTPILILMCSQSLTNGLKSCMALHTWASGMLDILGLLWYGVSASVETYWLAVQQGQPFNWSETHTSTSNTEITSG